MKNSHKGFIVPLLIIVIGVLLVGGGVYIYKNNTVSAPVSVQNLDNLSQASSTTNPPPVEAINACTNKVAGDTCSFLDKNVTAEGVCDTKPGILACSPNNRNGNVPVDASINVPSSSKAQTISNSGFTLSMPAKTSGGLLPKEYTCDGVGSSPALSWSGAPAGTKEYALLMSTIPVDGNTKWNWVLYKIPASTTGLAKNTSGIGTLGAGSDEGGAVKYQPPCSQGPGAKVYTFTLYALSSSPSLPSSAKLVTGAILTKAISSLVIASSSVDVSYSRDISSSTQQKTPQQDSKQPAGGAGQNQYTISQAISDQAQLNTMSFDGLGFITGNTCSDSFLPPGKVADFFGFQHLRDITANGKGHDTDFVTNSANNVLKTLNDSQKAQMLALAKSQGSLVDQFAYNRFPLMVAFRRQLTGDIPSGTSGLSKDAVMSYSSDLYALDAQISIQRAKLYASILNSLDSTQKAFLDSMVKGGFASWASLPNQVGQGLSKSESVLMMTYASEMFGWYAGDLEADTYFCPERQADYFGGFYIKDAPAIGNAGYTIGESITGDQGQAFLNVLDSNQKSTVTSVIDTQRNDLSGIVEKRRAISTELRKALTGGTVDETKVMSLAREYGALDGAISYYYATAFAKVYKTLTTDQKASLTKLKGLESYSCPNTSAYLYSEKITMPTVRNTDFLFK